VGREKCKEEEGNSGSFRKGEGGEGKLKRRARSCPRGEEVVARVAIGRRHTGREGGGILLGF